MNSTPQNTFFKRNQKKINLLNKISKLLQSHFPAYFRDDILPEYKVIMYNAAKSLAKDSLGM